MAEKLPMLLLFAALFGQASCSCQSGWYSYGDNCYKWISTALSWYDAFDECQENNAELVSIHSQEENDYIAYLIFGNYAWIGYSEINLDTYVWVDGSPTSYENWREGEPNDAGGAEECVVMYYWDGQWNDDHCSDEFNAVCKERGPTQPPATIQTLIEGTCPDGFLSEDWTNKCFRIAGVDPYLPTSWDDATKECMALNNGELASVLSAAEESFVLLIMEEIESDVWIGLHDSGSQYIWLDNAELEYTNYAPASTEEEDGVCFAIDRSLTYLGQWEKRNCEAELVYLCQAMREASLDTDPHPFADQYTDDACAEDYFLYHGRCFKFYDTQQTWYEASETCEQDGGLLAITVDLFEVARLTYESIIDRTIQESWIGVQYKRSTGQYLWGNNYPVTATFWDVNEPDLQTESSCVTISDGAWRDTDCNFLFPFFCMSGDISDILPTDATSTGMYCSDPDHRAFGDYCYYMSIDEDVTWEVARDKCLQQEMDLVSIHSLEENDFVREFTDAVRMGTSTWIGLQRDETGNFLWSDESDFDYYIWADGEPNDRNEECGMMKEEGTWNDIYCDYEQGYTCKREQDELVRICPNPDHRDFGDYCYYTSEGDMGTWSEARLKCQDMGMELASVHSEDENDFVHQFVDDVRSNTVTWIGLQRGSDGSFRWSDGSDFSFALWADGEPNDGTEECVWMKTDGEWNDVQCTEIQGYTCKMEKVYAFTTIPTPTTTTTAAITTRTTAAATTKETDGKVTTATALPATTQGKSGLIDSTEDELLRICPSADHRDFGDYCYYTSEGDMVTWSEARLKCQDMGMELTSVHSEDENDFVREFVDDVRSNTVTWIGLQRGSDGSFQWSDGSDFSFALWAEGEPNDGTEECVWMKTDGEWNDVQCTEIQGYTCKMEKVYAFTTIPSPTTTTTAAITTRATAAATTKERDGKVTTTSVLATTTQGTAGLMDSTEDLDSESSLESSSSAALSSRGLIAITVCLAFTIIIIIVVIFLTVTKRWTAVVSKIPRIRGSGYANQIYEINELNEVDES